MATMNVSLPDEMKEWVEAQVTAGKYANTSDVVRDLLRKARERDELYNELRAAVAEADASGYVPYDRSAIEKRLGIKKQSNAA